LNRAKFLDNRRLFLNRVLEARLKFIQLAFLFVEVLDEPSASLLHLIETSLEANPVRCLVALSVLDLVVGDGVLGVPDVMGDKFFNLVLPRGFQIVISYILDLVHKSFDILDQDIVSRDEDSLLGAASSGCTWLTANRVN